MKHQLLQGVILPELTTCKNAQNTREFVSRWLQEVRERSLVTMNLIFVQFIQSAEVKRFGVRGGLMRHLASREGYNRDYKIHKNHPRRPRGLATLQWLVSEEKESEAMP